MPTIPLHAPSPNRANLFLGRRNPLPPLLQTPTGLALVEVQGTINMPPFEASDPDSSAQQLEVPDLPVGRLVFPDYSVHNPPDDTAWMKRVFLYVGMHQRLTGEVKKLPNPMAVVRRRVSGTGEVDAEGEELEIVEVVCWKVLFSQRPEPAGM